MMKNQPKQEDKTEDHSSQVHEKINGMSHGFLNYLRPYYLGDESGPQKSRYVLWVDIMGSQGKMLRNVRTASIPLMKLHVAALNAKKKTIGGVDLFPVIDGIYVVSEHLGSIGFFISDVFRSMAAEFLVLNHWERSVIRGAVAYGPVIMGEECKEGAAILKESNYVNSILLGMPLVQAYTAEKGAPPFGVYVHESVRAFGQIAGHSVTVLFWRWWSKNGSNTSVATALLPSLRSYFEWCRKNSVTSGYPPDRIVAHQVLAEEYFGEFDNKAASSTSATPLKQPKHRKSKSQGPIEAKHDGVSGPDRQIAKLRNILNLTDEQVQQIKPILEAREKQLIQVSQDESLNRQVRQLKIIDLVNESKAAIQGLLTEDQRTILIDREQEHRANNSESLTATLFLRQLLTGQVSTKL
jgi:Spy/CpxP family protein refolding chaperone